MVNSFSYENLAFSIGSKKSYMPNRYKVKMLSVAYSRQVGNSASAFSYPEVWLDKPVWVPLWGLSEEEMWTTWGGDAHALGYKTGPPSIPVSWDHAWEEYHHLWCLWTWSVCAMGSHPVRSVDPFTPSLVPLGQLRLLGWATQFCLHACAPRSREVLMLCCQGRSCRCCKFGVGPNKRC